MKQNFVAVASDDVKYRDAADTAKAEWRLLSRGTGGLPQQGMYAMTSSGIPLGYLSTGWPTPDPMEVMKGAREAKARYDALPPSKRRLAQALGPGDRISFEEDAFRKPPGTLDLRVVARGLPFRGMTTFDQRHPMFFHIDRLWFKPSEWRAFLPPRAEVGSQTAVTGPARTRLVMLNHHQPGHSAWWDEHLRGGKTISRVTKVEGDRVHLLISGDYAMRGDSEWCKDRYDGQFRAEAVFDLRRQAFSRFDFAMLGTHTVGVMRENIHAGSPTQRVAVTGGLNPLADSDDAMIPQQWKYGYTLAWSRTP